MKKWTLVLMLLMINVRVGMGAVFPYSTGFENPTFTVGNIYNQDGWWSSPSSDIAAGASVVTAGVTVVPWEGSQMLRVGQVNDYGGQSQPAGITGTPTTGKTWMEVFLNHGERTLYNGTYWGDTTVTLGGNIGYPIYKVKFNAADHKIYVNNTDTTVSFSDLTWYRVGIEIDQTARAAKVFLNNELIQNTIGALQWNDPGLGWVELDGGERAGINPWPTNDHFSYFDQLSMGSGAYVPEPISLVMLSLGGLVRRRV